MVKEDSLKQKEISKTREEKLKEIHRKAAILRNEYKKQFSTAVITAFGLILALVWKDVITSLMPSITAPSLLEKYPILASLYSAIIITALAAIGIVIVAKWAEPKEKI